MSSTLDKRRARSVPTATLTATATQLAIRADRGWTQADLAERVEVSRQTINAIEKGKFDPSLPIAFRIAKVFGARIEEIFLDEQGSGSE